MTCEYCEKPYRRSSNIANCYCIEQYRRYRNLYYAANRRHILDLIKHRVRPHECRRDKNGQYVARKHSWPQEYIDRWNRVMRDEMTGWKHLMALMSINHGKSAVRE